MDYGTAAFGAGSCFDSDFPASGEWGVESDRLRRTTVGQPSLALDLGREPEPELIRFDLAVTISTMRYVSDLHRGRVNPRDFHFDLDINNKSLDFSGFLRAKPVNAPDVVAVMRRVEPPFPAYHQTVEALQTHIKMASHPGRLLEVFKLVREPKLPTPQRYLAMQSRALISYATSCVYLPQQATYTPQLFR
jgi:hypothetical protein